MMQRPFSFLEAARVGSILSCLTLTGAEPVAAVEEEAVAVVEEVD
jgi:hypothetical protein